MEERPFGRSGHLSSAAIFGAAALWQVEPAEADRTIQAVLDAGVNHFDVAPSYGQAEDHLGRWMGEIRERIYLGCKTMERTQEGARAEMGRSLARLRVQSFDLYQIHAVSTPAELDQATGPGGALAAIQAARAAGLTRQVGITTHGYDAPQLCLEALRRFDFDSVLFPYNFILAADPAYRAGVEALLAECAARGVGTMVIKSVAKARWGERAHTHTTWYEPFTSAEEIAAAVRFVLSQPVTGLCTPGDRAVLPLVLQACAAWRRLDAAGQEALLARAGEYELLFKPGEPA